MYLNGLPSQIAISFPAVGDTADVEQYLKIIASTIVVSPQQYFFHLSVARIVSLQYDHVRQFLPLDPVRYPNG